MTSPIREDRFRHPHDLSRSAPVRAYVSTNLYGGAIVCDLPENFADVSTLRQVPNNQEVYIDKDGFTSIIFDITERVGEPGSSPEIDGFAMTTHLEDLVGSDADTVKVWNTTETRFLRLDEGLPAYTLIATQTPNVDVENPSAAPDFTVIVLTLLRLEKESIDILITINVPHIKGEYDEDEVDLALGRQGELIGDAVKYAAKIWESFKIKD